MTTILVVEDELYIRENLVELLESEGYNVLSAGDGEEGYSIAQSKTPDLILSDVRMPKLDGLQLLKKLQNNPGTSAIPLIILSAKVEMSEIREGMTGGADDYITKPFKTQEVLTAIKTRLKKKKNYENNIDQLRNTFIKNVPHELRTPLISILGFSELIESELATISPDELKDMIHRINRSGKRLHRRIEKLIRLAYLLSLDPKQLPKTESLEVVPEVFSELVFRIGERHDRKKDITVNFEHARIQTEYDFLETVLEELVENSIKFSDVGSSIKVSGSAKDGNYYITVVDHGIGLEIKEISEIDPFKKIDTQNENREGLGLGLSIVKRIMELSGGTIRLAGTANNYSEVEVSFNLAN